MPLASHEGVAAEVERGRRLATYASVTEATLRFLDEIGTRYRVA